MPLVSLLALAHQWEIGMGCQESLWALLLWDWHWVPLVSLLALAHQWEIEMGSQESLWAPLLLD